MGDIRADDSQVTRPSYLGWLASETPTTWWLDSGDPEALHQALYHDATGVTTNPVLCYQALCARPALWRPLAGKLTGLAPAERAEALTRAVVTHAAASLCGEYRHSDGAAGYVCAQVNPAHAANREAMLAAARRYAGWAPNVAVKLPVTVAGLNVLEECAVEGITVTATVSFTLPQVIAVADRHRRGVARAHAAGRAPGRCFAVLMVGRLDDYIREVARDSGARAAEEDIRLAGLAVTKRADAIFRAEGYEAVLLVAALRGDYHITALAGARLVISVPPRSQAALLKADPPRVACASLPVPEDAVRRLCTIREFARAYAPDGMRPEEFISYGPTQRTLSQFEYAGWSLLEGLAL